MEWRIIKNAALSQKDRRGALRGLLLVLLLASAACNSAHQITTVSAENEANKIITVLQQYNIKADKDVQQKDNNTVINIVVTGSEADKAAAYQILNDYYLPRKPKPPEPGGGALDSSGIKEILIKQQDAQEKIIEQILQCRGVVEVVPSVSFPDTGPKIEDPGPSVSVQVVSIEDPPLVTKEEIRELLKNSVQNVKEDKISIVITPKKPLIPLPARADAPGASSFKWPSKRVLGIAGGLLLALGTTAGVWFLRGRRQDEWEEYDDESEASTPPEESGPAKQLPAA